jgi:hypothetical protein
MGEQSFQQEAGVLREAQSDSTTDSFKSVGAEYQQNVFLDTTEELIWKRASLDTPLMHSIEEAASMLGHVVEIYARSVNKQIKHLKRF